MDRAYLVFSFPTYRHCTTHSFSFMSDVPPTQPLVLCPWGYEADFPASLRRHQYGIHDGLIGHHTQIPQRRPHVDSTDGGGPSGRREDRVGGVSGAAVRLAAGGGGRALDGNVADDESEEPASPSPSLRSQAPSSRPASSQSGSTAHSAVQSQLGILLEVTRILVPPNDNGGAAADAVPEYMYSSLGLQVRALYEALGDARCAEPLVHLRKRARTGRFNTVRLRALQRFVLQVGGAGLSEKDEEFFYEFLDVWDGTKAGIAEDAGHHATLRYAFPSVNAFRNALRDDLDAAALNEGWQKIKLVEGGLAYEAYFRDVLQVMRALMKKKQNSIQLWSGVGGPAPPSDKRETPMNGDAFKLCEELVMKNRDDLSCVLDLHVFSDSSQLSLSGGTCHAVRGGCLGHTAARGGLVDHLIVPLLLCAFVARL